MLPWYRLRARGWWLWLVLQPLLHCPPAMRCCWRRGGARRAEPAPYDFVAWPAMRHPQPGPTWRLHNPALGGPSRRARPYGIAPGAPGWLEKTPASSCGLTLLGISGWTNTASAVSGISAGIARGKGDTIGARQHPVPLPTTLRPIVGGVLRSV